MMAVVGGIAFADQQGMQSSESYGYPTMGDSSWPDAQADTSLIREPVDTGAVPKSEEGMSGEKCCGGESEVVEEIGTSTFRHGLDNGP